MKQNESLAREQRGWFEAIHRHPELGNEEFETAALVRQVLTAHGIRLLPCALPTGVVCEIGHGDRPVIGLRADMDALPIQEETDLPYRSEVPGCMHACGHDFHTAALMAAAILLHEAEDTLPGRVRLFFQPAEEITDGALQMIRTGLTDPAELMLSLHTYPFLEPGTVGIREGAVMAAVDQFKVTVTGRGAHAASPHLGLDPIPVLAEITLALQTLVSRRSDPFDQVLLSVTHLEAGNTWNVIPERGELEGTLRTLVPESRAATRERFHRICRGISEAHGCTCEITWMAGPPALYNDARLCERAKAVAEELGLRVERQPCSMGGEDFSEYLDAPRKRPGIFIRIGTGGAYASHHPRFTAAPEALFPASVLMAELAKSLLNNPLTGGANDAD